MTDLVGVITAQLMHAIEQDGGDRRTDEERREDFEMLARAAIAAVLDDLMEPTDAMTLNASDAITGFPHSDQRKACARAVIRLAIKAKRRELALAAPAAPEECIGGIHGPGWPQP